MIFMTIAIGLSIWWISEQIQSFTSNHSEYSNASKDECTIIDIEKHSCNDGSGIEYQYIATSQNSCNDINHETHDHDYNLTTNTINPLISDNNECYENKNQHPTKEINQTYTCYINDCDDELFSFSNNETSDDLSSSDFFVHEAEGALIIFVALFCCCMCAAQWRKESKPIGHSDKKYVKQKTKSSTTKDAAHYQYVAMEEVVL